MEQQTPPRPCTECNCPRIAYIRDAWFELVCDAKKDAGNTFGFRVKLFICTACGALRWHAREHQKFLDAVGHHVFDVSSSYRG